MLNIAQEIALACNELQQVHGSPITIILTSRLIAEIAQADGLQFDSKAKRLHGLRWFPTNKNIIVLSPNIVLTPARYRRLVISAVDVTHRLNLQ